MKKTKSLCFASGMYAAVLTFGLALMFNSAHAQYTLRGRISDQSSGVSLPGAHVMTGSIGRAISNSEGDYLIGNLPGGASTLSISYMGYKTTRLSIFIRRDTVIDISLSPVPLLGEEVNILATRAQKNTPTTYAIIGQKQISSVNLGKDMPFLLQTAPSTVVASDAGNGVGYTGINIRGSDLTRINVTVNGIPINDAESQGVWFVNMPDLASSTENIQIQRGVGTSTNGAGAFGATINLMTSTLNQDPYGELSLSGGSFNTFKSTLKFGTGLTANRFSVDGRLSWIHSDGYIDRAFSNLKSYYLSAGYFGKNTTLKIITFSGFERTYQAWAGVPGDSLETNRTYNPSGEYTDANGNLAYYDNQTDNYQQDHYQLIFSQLLLKNWNFNTAIHYTRGRGYYESYKQDESFSDYGLNDVIIGGDTITSTNLVNRKMMDNDFCGLTFSTNYNVPDKLKLTLGGAWNRYYGEHFGKITWAQYASNGDNDRNWYYNTGLKYDFNIYAKASWTLFNKLTIYADMQYRHVGYTMLGTLDDLRSVDQNHRYDFFNPKAGLFYTLNKKHSLYASFGIANREPSRNNYKDADPWRMPTPETLYDYEAGYNFTAKTVTLNGNLFYMRYRDQLVLTGEINNVGEAIMVNVPQSYRVGIEISAAIDIFKKLRWDANLSLSRNRIMDFTSYIDVYDSSWNYVGQNAVPLGETPLSFSPDVVAGSILTYKPIEPLSLSLITKYVGKQYLDNTGSSDRSLNGYLVNGIAAGYSIPVTWAKEIRINLTVNNLFSARYETGGWVYQYLYSNSHYQINGLFPQALINFLAGITIRI